MRRRRLFPSGSYVSTYNGPKQMLHRPSVSVVVVLLATVRPQFWFWHTRGGGRERRWRSWWRRCVVMSLRRIILLQRWQSVVRPPSTTSCGVRPDKRTSGSCMSRSEPSCCGTMRWQNWQRMGLPGQVVVRCWARRGRLLVS